MNRQICADANQRVVAVLIPNRRFEVCIWVTLLKSSSGLRNSIAGPQYASELGGCAALVFSNSFSGTDGMEIENRMNYELEGVW
jgi:hypothetical protein